MTQRPVADSADRIGILENQLSELREKIIFLESDIKNIREEKEKYQMIADFAQNWEFWIDPKSAFIWISPSCNDITGFTPDEFFKNPALFYDLVYEEDEKLVRHYIHDSKSLFSTA